MAKSFDNKKALRFVITLGTGKFGSSNNDQITLQGFRASVDIDKAGGVQMGTLRAKIYGVSQSDMNTCTSFTMQAPRDGGYLYQPNTVEVFAIDGDVETLVFAGNIVNAPLPPGADGALWRKAMETRVLPALEAFRPELVFVSAGFDAHRADPLADMALEDADYAWAAVALKEAAALSAKGRIVASLEGGYDLRALGSATAAFVGAGGSIQVSVAYSNGIDALAVKSVLTPKASLETDGMEGTGAGAAWEEWLAHCRPRLLKGKTPQQIAAAWMFERKRPPAFTVAQAVESLAASEAVGQARQAIEGRQARA